MLDIGMFRINIKIVFVEQSNVFRAWKVSILFKTFQLPNQTKKTTIHTLENLITITVFENRLKSHNQHCEQSELRLQFEYTKDQ